FSVTTGRTITWCSVDIYLPPFFFFGAGFAALALGALAVFLAAGFADLAFALGAFAAFAFGAALGFASLAGLALAGRSCLSAGAALGPGTNGRTKGSAASPLRAPSSTITTSAHRTS